MYQCPLGLVLHFYIAFIIILVVIAAAMYQCPFRLVLHFYNASEESHFVAEKNVSMPFRASASFLRTRLLLKLQEINCINALSG